MEEKSQEGKLDEDKVGVTDAVANELASLGITEALRPSTETARTTERGVNLDEQPPDKKKSGNLKGDKEPGLDVNLSSDNKSKDSKEEREGDGKGTLAGEQSKGDGAENYAEIRGTRTGGEGIAALNNVDHGGEQIVLTKTVWTTQMPGGDQDNFRRMERMQASKKTGRLQEARPQTRDKLWRMAAFQEKNTK